MSTTTEARPGSSDRAPSRCGLSAADSGQKTAMDGGQKTAMDNG
nr:hypothetical protein [uncultured Acetatifactor sp.]